METKIIILKTTFLIFFALKDYYVNVELKKTKKINCNRYTTILESITNNIIVP